MCTVMAGIAAIGGLMQYRAARQQAKAESAYYSAMAEQNATNAKIAEQQRSQISDRYLQQQKQLDDRRRLIIAQHAADAGASGLTNSGSVLDADSAAYDQWKESSMNLLWNQRVDTHDAWVNQANYMNQASANRASAANARSQGRLSALSTLIGTASSVYTGLRDYGTAATAKEAAPSLQARTGITGDLMKGTLSYGSPSAMYQSDRYKPTKLNFGNPDLTATPAAYNSFLAPTRFKGLTGWRK